jgi:endonuclease/exonuclease/phosphatase family metal-dependent hydrolase
MGSDRKTVLSVLTAAMTAALWSSPAAAQTTTVILSQPDTQVTDTTIRNGAYSTTNYDNSVLITRASSDPDWERRAIFKFDTKNTVPENSQITNATLTLTVKSGLGAAGQTRPLGVYRIPEPFQSAQATWVVRQDGLQWATPGGSPAGKFSSGNATNVSGGKVSIDVTYLVQQTVLNAYDSRYTRLELIDEGGDAKESYREYYSSEDSVASRRPTLTIVYPGTTTTQPPTQPSSSSTIKLLQWNMAQGYGTDGKSNIDRIVNYIVQWRPDVISLNETMKYSSTSSHPQQIADKLKAITGDTWTYKWVQKWGASTGEGEAVMTRLGFDMTASDLLSYNRSVAMGAVNVNGRNISVFSTHLDNTSSSYRLTEVRQLVPWAATFQEARIVLGDFNWYPGTTEINEMGKTYYDSWAIAKSQGTAVSYPGNPDGYTRNNRIDYIWYSKGATTLVLKKVQVFDTRDASGYKPSDHNPVMSTFEVR